MRRWVDGWMDFRTDARRQRCMERKMGEGETKDRRTDTWTAMIDNSQTDIQIDRRTDCPTCPASRIWCWLATLRGGTWCLHITRNSGQTTETQRIPPALNIASFRQTKSNWPICHRAHTHAHTHIRTQTHTYKHSHKHTHSHTH